MTQPPASPRLYHITHVDNLASIVADGCLVSDRRILDRGGPARSIGLDEIKRRRVEFRGVPCHPGTRVGDYVPFYFCPRSVMLYVIFRRNHPGLTYRDGQALIVHLEADLPTVVRWADGGGVAWAFSLTNAAARYAEFRSEMDQLGQLDWTAIQATDFRAEAVKERKQAEFLVHGQVPLQLVTRIGVHSARVRTRVLATIAESAYRPRVEVRPEWYF